MSPPDDSTLLARLDERTRGIAEDISEMKEASKLYVTKAEFNPANYVTRTEFSPVRSIVFGAVALILVGFMGALLYLTGWK